MSEYDGSCSPDVEKCKICGVEMDWEKWVIDGGMCQECRKANWGLKKVEELDIW